MFYFGSQDFLAALFFLLGHAFRHYSLRKFRWWEGLLATMLVVAGSFLWDMGMHVSVYENGRMLPYILTAVLGTWTIYSLPWHRLNGRLSGALQFVGNNTLTILTWHLLTFKLVSLIIIGKYDLPIMRLGDSHYHTIVEYAQQGWWVAYFLTAMLTTCAIAYCNRWIKNSWLKL